MSRNIYIGGAIGLGLLFVLAVIYGILKLKSDNFLPGEALPPPASGPGLNPASTNQQSPNQQSTWQMYDTETGAGAEAIKQRMKVINQSKAATKEILNAMNFKPYGKNVGTNFLPSKFKELNSAVSDKDIHLKSKELDPAFSEIIYEIQKVLTDEGVYDARVLIRLAELGSHSSISVFADKDQLAQWQLSVFLQHYSMIHVDSRYELSTPKIKPMLLNFVDNIIYNLEEFEFALKEKAIADLLAAGWHFIGYSQMP